MGPACPFTSLAGRPCRRASSDAFAPRARSERGTCPRNRSALWGTRAYHRQRPPARATRPFRAPLLAAATRPIACKSRARDIFAALMNVSHGSSIPRRSNPENARASRVSIRPRCPVKFVTRLYGAGVSTGRRTERRPAVVPPGILLLSIRLQSGTRAADQGRGTSAGLCAAPSQVALAK